MRKENLTRLNHYSTNIADPLFLHYKFLFRDIKDAINEYGKGKVLDIGCGNKPYEKLFVNATSYTGCDVMQSSDNKVDIICEATNIPLQSGQFDTIFSTQVLEHVEDHLKLLQESYRLLEKNGKIILSAPMLWEHHEIPYDFFRFTKYGMLYIFEKAGFKIIKIKANGGKWSVLGQLTQTIVSSSTRSKRNLFRKFLFILWRFFFKYIINATYYFLEKIDQDEDLITLNWLVVAEKSI